MSFWGMFLTVAVVTATISIVALIAQAGARKSLRDSSKSWLATNGFSEYNIVFSPGDCIGINYGLSKVGFSSQGKNIVFDFSALVSVEVAENGATVTKANRANQLVGAAVGGLVFGGLGAVVGGLSGKTTAVQKVSNVSLNVITNDRDVPFVCINVLSAFGDQAIDKNSITYKMDTKDLMTWFGRLKAIIESQ